MNRVFFVAWLQRWLSDAKASLRLQKKTHANLRIIMRGMLLIAIALFSFSIAYTHLLPSATNESSPAPKSTAYDTGTAEGLPQQTNPLFAKYPSWVQNFTSQIAGFPDPLYWNVLVGPADNSNKEQQYYTADNSNLRIENGALRLIATRQNQPMGYKYGSARLETQGKQSFLYGRIDITAKLPTGTGTWPAAWLLPANNKYADKSPVGDPIRYKNGGEIDIIEAVGFQQDIVYGVAHTATSASRNTDGTGSFNSVKVPGSDKDFNKYSLLWTPTSLTYAVNDRVFFVYNRQDGSDYRTWPFDQPFYLIINLAMGGTWGGMDTANYPDNGIDDKSLPTSFDIRSIYYYPYKDR